MMRMKRIWTLVLLAVLAAAAASSCGKDEPTPVTPEKPDTPVTPDPPKPKVVDFDKYDLKEVAAKAGLKLGVSFTYWEYRNNTQVANILKHDFAAVTFGNEMKHDGIVQQGGAYDFTKAEAMAGWAKTCGTELFGHTLGWHSQQQRAYLNNLISKAARNNNASLLKQNWNFETGTLDGFRADGFEIFQSLYDVFAGDYAAKAASDGATLTVDASLEAGKPYTFSFWAKTLAKEGSLQVAAGDGQSLRTSVTGKWHKYSVPQMAQVQRTLHAGIPGRFRLPDHRVEGRGRRQCPHSRGRRRRPGAYRRGDRFRRPCRRPAEFAGHFRDQRP